MWSPEGDRKSALVADDVRRAGAFVGLFDVEFDLLAFFEVRAANVFHVEENVIVRVLSRDETVTACVVEEINLTVCHCKYTYRGYMYKGSESISTTTVCL